MAVHGGAGETCGGGGSGEVDNGESFPLYVSDLAAITARPHLHGNLPLHHNATRHLGQREL